MRKPQEPAGRGRRGLKADWPLGLLALHCLAALAGPARGQPDEAAAQQRRSAQQFFDSLARSDTCGAVYTSKLHGYDVREYDVVTKDGYRLRMHRLVHPEDHRADRGLTPQQREQALAGKKPYLLVHGLIGTSASFLLNVEDAFRAPDRSFQARKHMVEQLEARANVFQHEWESTAGRLQAGPAAQTGKPAPPSADLNEIIYDGDELNFAAQFRQAYRKFPLPTEALPHTSHSLAFTLSNFGYDVWLVNLRGNHYSRGFQGPLTAERAEYWDFTIETLVREDLMAAINFITTTKGNAHDPIGLVTFSYSGAFVMNLLTKFPAYVERLQPIVMLAPTLMTGARDRTSKSRYALKLTDKLLSKNGPFPSLGRSFKSSKSRQLSSLLSLDRLDEKLSWLICSLPIASKLCRFMEAVIHGESQQVSTVRGLLGAGQRSAALMKRDNDCGQTSKAILHQIFKNIDQENIMPAFMAHESVERRRQLAPGSADARRRSVILIHSAADEVATPSEVERIRATALKTLALLDYVIKAPDFGHTDFLFSRRNQYLVNAEVARQVLLFDFLAYQGYANRPSEVPLGIRVGRPGPSR